MAIPAKKFADVVVARFTKKPPAAAAEPDGDEGPMPSAPPDGDGDDDGDEPGANGKILIAAQRRGDGEAVEEAIKAIVRECLEEQGK